MNKYSAIIFFFFTFLNFEIYAACSAFMGKATINEIYFKKNNASVGGVDFIEISILDNSITANDYDQWQITLCHEEGNGRNKRTVCDSPAIQVSDMDDSTYPWLHIESSDFDRSFLDFKDGFDISLQQVNGSDLEVIDYISINGFSENEDSSCKEEDLTFYNPTPATQNGTVDLYRSPSDTGSWQKENANNFMPTQGASNDGELEIVSCDIYFPDAVQGHSDSSDIKFKDNARLLNSSDLIVTFPSLDDDTSSGNQTCSPIGKCSASGTFAPALTLPTFITTNVSTDINLASGTSTIGDNSDFTQTEIDNLIIDNNATVVFNTSSSDFIIDNAEFSGNAKITFNSGVYWFDELEIIGNTEIFINGRVTIFVNGQSNHLDIEDNAKINITGEAKDLAIISYTKIHLKDNAEINSVLYSDGTEIKLQANAKHTGAISTSGRLELKDNALATFEDTTGVQIGSLCEGEDEPEIDHFLITHDGEGLTCVTETIQITACANADCSATVSTATDVVLSIPGTENQTITVATSESATFSFTSAGTATLSLDQTFSCQNGLSTSCDIVFNNAGFIWGNITHQTSGIEFDGITLQAVEDNNGVCEGIFTGDVAVDLAMEYQNPDQTTEQSYTINGSAIVKNLAGGNDYSEDITLNFGNDSTAIINDHIYNDAGQIRLKARYNGDNLNILGTSDAFWVKPARLLMSATSGATLLDNNSASDAPFYRAGEEFLFTVTAQNDSGGITTNYQPNQIQLSVVRTAPTSTGTVDGLFTYAQNQSISSLTNTVFQNATLNSFINGVSSSSSAQYSEVGTLSLDIQDVNYGGVDDFDVEADPINVGRFTPAHFTLTLATIDHACGSDTDDSYFTYMGQNVLRLIYEIEARNVDGVLTQNYVGDFNKVLTPFSPLVAENLNENLSDRLTGFNGSWSGGVYRSVDNNIGSFSRLTPTNGSYIDGPYDDLQIGISITDSDGITLGTLDMLTVEDNFTAKNFTTASTNRIRYGRLLLENTYGPETLDLPLPMVLQYWNGTAFVTNELDDNCTTFDSANITSTPNVDIDEVNGNFIQGTTNDILITPPANGTEVELEYNIDAWLEFDWDGDLILEDPEAIATFRLFRGNDRIIQWREIIN